MHSHSHAGHHHHHAPASFGRAFAVGVSLNGAFVAIQVVYGLKAGSMALLADAGHNLGDVISLMIAWSASVLAMRAPSANHTYGWRSSSILAALANALLLLFAVGAVGWEAVRRLLAPTPVQASIVVWVAAIGIIINTLTALMFLSGSKGDLNIRSAFMHMASDALMAAGILIAGTVIAFTHAAIIDPIVSLVIVALILLGTWSVLKDALRLALQAVPPGLEITEVRQCLLALPGVHGLHDLHVWAMSTTDFALTAHLQVSKCENQDRLLALASQAVHDQFGIHHATIQIEFGDPSHPCSCDCEN